MVYLEYDFLNAKRKIGKKGFFHEMGCTLVLQIIKQLLYIIEHFKFDIYLSYQTHLLLPR